MYALLFFFFLGGHNLLILAQGLGQYTQLGTSIDDAIGEAYDKTAKWLGLDMRRSGGPAIEELAQEGDAESIKFSVSYFLGFLNLILVIFGWMCVLSFCTALIFRFQWNNIKIATSHMLVWRLKWGWQLNPEICM